MEVRARLGAVGAAVVIGAAALAGCAAPGAGTAAGGSSSARPAGAAAITLSFIGDNILGTDDRFDAGTSLPARWAAAGHDPAYFFRNVAPILRADDLTVANVEVVLSERGQKVDKGTGEFYHFRGSPALAESLRAGGIEAATVANNHTGDYGPDAYGDTLAALRGVGTAPFGDAFGAENDHIAEVKGVKVGLFGMMTWLDSPENRSSIEGHVRRLRERGAQIVIPFMHWGIESQHVPYAVQTALAQHAIDAGADIVIGSHPHVLQSMAQYKGRLIVYSLGNFSFGGNNNPADKRSMIVQTRVTVAGPTVTGVDYRIVPTRVSSTADYNDFVPTPYGPAETSEVLAFMNSISPTLHGTIGAAFVPVPAS
ncbi:CapA family protein [Tsukamurella spumae]|uniref:CapA family protein n=1 Tax=Tsukamurella spumae TaxID=44753 RepID=A0A846X2F4_9ACTN|nr:CapA family protein [Tsukamurella spumae]NKY19271.1 CapA family protein [Tsukamurella spumae]